MLNQSIIYNRVEIRIICVTVNDLEEGHYMVYYTHDPQNNMVYCGKSNTTTNE